METNANESASECFDTPKIEIVSKKIFIESKSKTVEYVFNLNSAVDSIWLALFKTELLYLPPGVNRSDLKVEIQGAELHLHCLPVNFESKYSVVKAAIKRTNEKYPLHRDEKLRKIASFQDECRKKEESKIKYSENIKNQFDRFQI
jgi:hypothetical protein